MSDLHEFTVGLERHGVQELVQSLGVKPQDAVLQTLFVGMSMVEAQKRYGLDIILRDRNDGSEWTYSVDNDKTATAAELPKPRPDISTRHTIGNVIHFSFGRESKNDTPT